jgi:hypothetical protein
VAVPELVRLFNDQVTYISEGPSQKPFEKPPLLHQKTGMDLARERLKDQNSHLDEEDEQENAELKRRANSLRRISPKPARESMRRREMLGESRKKSSSYSAESTAIINIKDLRKGAFGPHYSLAEVLHFRGNFNSVDVDMSGTLDMNEWMKFLHRMNQKMNPTDAQLLFMHIDHDRSGTIEMSELLPVVFSNAKPEQVRWGCTLQQITRAANQRTFLPPLFSAPAHAPAHSFRELEKSKERDRQRDESRRGQPLWAI